MHVKKIGEGARRSAPAGALTLHQLTFADLEISRFANIERCWGRAPADNLMHTPEDLARALVLPAKQAASAIKDAEAKFLYRLVSEQRLRRTLEVGFAYAKSAAYIMAASASAHVAIDPFQAAFDDTGLENIERLGLSGYLEFHRDHSHLVLPELLRAGRTFDLAFIDGGHRYDEIFVDVYYADLMLEQDGYILLHDTWMRSTCLVESYLRRNRRDYEPIPTGLKNLALLRKTGQDSRSWRHFKEFYTLKSLITHRVVSLLLDYREGATP
jgi:predicted O-methyltransferase YrrM